MDFPLRTICTLILGLSFTVAAAAGPLPQFTQPEWSKLSQEQRRVLAPLAAEWRDMEAFRRKKWIGIADRFASMSPDEQARIQQRMREWAKLRPEERKQVREKYKKLKKVSPEQREALLQNWVEYQASPIEEQQRLNNEASRRSPGKTLPATPSVSRLSQSPAGRQPPGR